MKPEYQIHYRRLGHGALGLVNKKQSKMAPDFYRIKALPTEPGNEPTKVGKRSVPCQTVDDTTPNYNRSAAKSASALRSALLSVICPHSGDAFKRSTQYVKPFELASR